MDGKVETIRTLSEISNDVTVLILPVLATVLVVLFGVMIKDAGTQLAKGLAFRLNGVFREGDIVFLDGERAIIVKIGLFRSVFGITKDDGTYCWRYISNLKMDNIKLEKILNLTMMKLPERDGAQDDKMVVGEDKTK
jgi:hypothetical protein